jgi:hypothetical protein
MLNLVGIVNIEPNTLTSLFLPIKNSVNYSRCYSIQQKLCYITTNMIPLKKSGSARSSKQETTVITKKQTRLHKTIFSAKLKRQVFSKNKIGKSTAYFIGAKEKQQDSTLRGLQIFEQNSCKETQHFS